MKTIQEVIQLATRYLEEKGVQEPRLQAEEILSLILQMPRLDLYLHFEQPLEEDELAACRVTLARRAKGEPLGYLRGEQTFLDCELKVSPQALIPRQETEILGHKVQQYLQDADLEGKTLWDLCTGSGCLGIALKKRFPELRVILSDVSADALSLAQANAKRNHVEVDLRQGDLLEPFQGESADFVTCNPPYIPTSHIGDLDPGVKDFEPHLALDGGPDGLCFYRKLSESLAGHVFSRGRVWFELGHDQGGDVIKLFSKPEWRTQELTQDWAGHDRFFSLERV